PLLPAPGGAHRHPAAAREARGRAGAGAPLPAPARARGAAAGLRARRPGRAGGAALAGQCPRIAQRHRARIGLSTLAAGFDPAPFAITALNGGRMQDPTTFIELLDRRVAERGPAVAYRFLVTGDVDGPIDEMSHEQLGRRARSLGAWLQAEKAHGERVLLL